MSLQDFMSIKFLSAFRVLSGSCVCSLFTLLDSGTEYIFVIILLHDIAFHRSRSNYMERMSYESRNSVVVFRGVLSDV